MFGIVPAEAARFSLVLWGLTTIPLLATGLISLTVAGMKFSELQQAAKAKELLPRRLNRRWRALASFERAEAGKPPTFSGRPLPRKTSARVPFLS